MEPVELLQVWLYKYQYEKKSAESLSHTRNGPTAHREMTLARPQSDRAQTRQNALPLPINPPTMHIIRYTTSVEDVYSEYVIAQAMQRNDSSNISEEL